MKNDKLRLKGKLKFYLGWPLMMIIVLALASVGALLYDYRAGIFVLVFLGVYTVVVFICYFYTRAHILRDIVKLSVGYRRIQNKLLKELTIPYGVFLGDGKMVWVNDEFKRAFLLERKEKTIQKIIPDILEEAFPKKDNTQIQLALNFNDRDYLTTIRKTPIKELTETDKIFKMAKRQESVLIIDFRDVTEINSYIRKHKDQQLVAGLIYIDNYEDVMESVEEERQSLVLAIIDRKINKYINDVDGLVKKLEKDKYFVVVRNESYEKLEGSKFSLLQEIKGISTGAGTRAASLSIGMGVNCETYLKSYNNARIAIDLALARGGDQVVIKGLTGIKYFGGKNEQAARNTRVKARVKAEALREFIIGKDLVLIMGHKILDADSFGASMGIYRCAKALEKKVHIIVDEKMTNVWPLYEEVLKNNAYEKDLFISPERSLELVDDNTMVVVVDVNKPGLTECPKLLDVAKTIVVLDHHRKSSASIENAVLSYIEPYSSSTCELVAEILQYIVDDIKLPVVEANCLYAGIMIDTRNFMNRTGVRTFEAAAFLRGCGADINRIRKMFRDDFDFYRQKAKAIQNAEVYYEEFAIAKCYGDGDNSTVLAAQTANELLDINKIKASFAFVEYNELIYLSARSIDEVNVQIIAEKLGGGGHINSAGAQLEYDDMDEAVETLKGVINNMIEDEEL
jgi:c-di-AMP phosphodiesterase-like protein